MKNSLKTAVAGILFALGIKTANANFGSTYPVSEAPPFNMVGDSAKAQCINEGDSTIGYFIGNYYPVNDNPGMKYNYLTIFEPQGGSADSAIKYSVSLDGGLGVGYDSLLSDYANVDSAYNQAFDNIAAGEEQTKFNNANKKGPGLLITRKQAEKEFMGKTVLDLSGRNVKTISSGTYFTNRRKYTVIK